MSTQVQRVKQKQIFKNVNIKANFINKQFIYNNIEELMWLINRNLKFKAIEGGQ